MAKDLAAQKEVQESYLAELQKDRVQVRKTLEEIKLQRDGAKIERESIELERQKVTALLETMQRSHAEDERLRKESVEVTKQLGVRLQELETASRQRSDRILKMTGEQAARIQGLDGGLASIAKKLADFEELQTANHEAQQAASEKVTQAVIQAANHAATKAATQAAQDAAHAAAKEVAKEAAKRENEQSALIAVQLAALKKVLASEREDAARAREEGRADRQGLEARLDALAEVMERSFERLEKQAQRAAEDRKKAASASTGGANSQKSALPGKNERDPDRLLLESQAFWKNPFIAIPGAFLLLVLLYFLLRRGPDEIEFGQRDGPELAEREALEESLAAATRGEAPDATAIPAHPEPREERRMSAPRPGGDESQARITPQASMPRPRCVSLRIPSDELAEGAEELLQERLARDPRILVEPRPRLERRGDGSLSARFYSVGGLAETEVEAISRSLRSLVANR